MDVNISWKSLLESIREWLRLLFFFDLWYLILWNCGRSFRSFERRESSQFLLERTWSVRWLQFMTFVVWIYFPSAWWVYYISWRSMKAHGDLQRNLILVPFVDQSHLKTVWFGPHRQKLSSNSPSRSCLQGRGLDRHHEKILIGIQLMDMMLMIAKTRLPNKKIRSPGV